MKYIVITGGAGYVGSSLANFFLSKKKKIIILDNLSTGKKFLIPRKCKFIKLNLCNKSDLKKFFYKYSKKIECIIHAAALTKVQDGERYPKKYFFNNIQSTKNILENIVKFNIKNLIYSSTCAVYSTKGNQKIQIREDDSKKPEYIYGKTKLLSEILIQNTLEGTRINYAILRYFNVVGAFKNIKSGQISNTHLLPTIVKNIIDKKNFIKIFGKNFNSKDGTCIRDYIDINDLCELHFLTYKKIKKQSLNKLVLNCGYGKGYSVLQIIKIVKKVLKKDIKIIFSPRRKGDSDSVYCDTSLQKKAFKTWKRKFTIEDSILSTYHWYLKVKKNGWLWG